MLYVRSLILAGLALLVVSLSSGQPSQALPPSLPLFSVRDLRFIGGPFAYDITPLVTGLPAPGLTCTAADLMTDPAAPLAFPCAPRLAPAPPGPVPDAASAATVDLGLDLFGPFTDELDGISVGEGIHPSFDFDFSVDRAPFNGGATVGGVSCFGGPDVTTEAFLGEAQGDIFNTGSLPLSPFGCNAMVTDEAILGLIAPNPVAPGIPPLDDIDALTEEIVGAGPCTLSGGFTPITTCPAMTIAPTSVVLAVIPPSVVFPFPPADAASILVPPATPAIPPEIPAVGCAAYSGGFPCMAVHSSVLGLSPADDIDALCWFDINGNGLPDPPYWAGGLPAPGDMYAFSLTPLSPAPFSPADILIPTPFGSPAVLTPAFGLGLLPTDDVDALMCHSDDVDGDLFPDMVDNCPTAFNTSQADIDADGIGNPCDTEGPSPNTDGLGGADDCADGVDNDFDGLSDGAEPLCDVDGDGIADIVDNCATTFNPGQADVDFDGLGDACDTEGPSPNGAGFVGLDDCIDGVDNDGDGLTDGAEPLCDSDGDGLPDVTDPCPDDALNDTDADGICEGTGFNPPKVGDRDNCPTTPNAAQADVDSDLIGDACDTEGPNGNTNGTAGGDDCLDTVDNDGDGLTDIAEPSCLLDSDGDGQPDAVDSCPTVATTWITPLGDTDCDSFLDTIETFVGTDPNDGCANTAAANDEADDKWPTDMNDNQRTNTLDVAFYVGNLNTFAPGPPYLVRLDMTLNGIVNTLDIAKYVPLLNDVCTGLP